jgi:hypothetical protein
MQKLGWLFCVLTLCVAINFTHKESQDQIARDIANTKSLEIQNLQSQSQPMNDEKILKFKKLQENLNNQQI